jgi:RNA polymerase sigma-70 factor (ECF subfamily)
MSQRDEERFTAIYRSNFPRLAGFVLRRVPDPHDAADIVASTFLLAWSKVATLPDDDIVLWWLYATARRVMANAGRSRLRNEALLARVAGELERAMPAWSGPPGEESLIVSAAFSRLRPADREVLRLVGWEGLDSAGLAAVLECSPNAARITLHRARSRFARELERETPTTTRAHLAWPGVVLQAGEIG